MAKTLYNADGTERKFSTATLKECETPFGHGTVTGNFTAERYPGDGEPLDTRVELTISPFAITWKDKEKLTKELAALIAKYQI